MYPGHFDSKDLSLFRPCEQNCGNEKHGPAVVGNCDSEIIPPVRGLILGYNRRGAGFPLTELKKWIRLNTSCFAVEKIDFLADEGCIRYLPSLLEFARAERSSLSLRTADLGLVDVLAAGDITGLHDVFLSPEILDGALLKAWFVLCEEKCLPVRLQVSPSPAGRPDPEAFAEQISSAVSVNVTLEPSFSTSRTSTCLSDGQEAVRWMNAVVRALRQHGVETHLMGLPFCHIEEGNYPCAVNTPQFFRHHQHYLKRAYSFGETIFSASPNRTAMLIENMLSQGSSLNNVVDNALLPWILGHPKAYARTWMLHKIRRHLPRFGRPAPLPESAVDWEASLKRGETEKEKALGGECSRCRFYRICDRSTPAFQRALPGMRVKARPGTAIVDPLCFLRTQAAYYDVIDDKRRHLPAHLELLAKRACEITAGKTPSREIPVDAYEIENHYNPIDDASKRWLSLSRGELQSTVLMRVEVPFTMMLTFGGGIAEQIGFRFGRGVRIVCPMVDYSHRLVLHVDKDGYYVLLRDGVLVRPTEFDAAPALPERLPAILEPRICIHNIDGFILTQTLLLWEGADTLEKARRSRVKYSVIIVSTKYARRLQAVLLALAHQRGVDPASYEVIVAYVPGIDGTDDLLESMGHSCPHLSVVRSTFSEDFVRSKGFMINESMRLASGEWIILMDSDILVPPNMFSKIEEIIEGAHFIAPDGRRMLSAEVTSRILLGEVRPWEEFDELCKSAPEYRYREGSGVPCGFFQCVRRDVLERLPYHELDHFEASDHVFGKEVLATFGPETRMEHVDVLHLDHGGRQWYGTDKHR